MGVPKGTKLGPRLPFEDKYIPEPNSGCWLWIAGMNGMGYGDLRINKKSILAHRRSWQIHRGPIPDGMFVLHKCDTPACVNPDHLFLGTQTENMQDKHRKRRHAHGERASYSRLTDDDVLAIRSSTETQTTLARRYGVRRDHISRIRSRQRWSHIS